LVYLMGFTLLIGMFMSMTGIPFGKTGFYRPVYQPLAVAPSSVSAPAAPAQPAALATQPAQSTTAPAVQHAVHTTGAATPSDGAPRAQSRLEGPHKIIEPGDTLTLM
jgi:hypothetical protein